jgi:hypothetical protein
MNESNYSSYSISLEQTGLQTKQIQCNDNLSSAAPTLQKVLDWIDAQATKVRDAVNEMRQNKKTIVLHARLPVRNLAGLCKHERFSDIPANGDEINELKRRVTAAYEKA